MTRHDAEVRVLTEARDLVAASNLFRTAMVGFPPLSEAEETAIDTLLDPGRTLGAFVGDELAGTTHSAASTLTLPGGRRVSHAAVTHVGVLPTRARQGIGALLLEHQLRDLHERGEVVATLRASEATIYGRFGYGVATTSQTLEARGAVLRPGLSAAGRVALLDEAAVWDVLPRIYERARPPRPGTIDRPGSWWRNQRLRAERDTSARYVATYGEPGAESGFVRYHPIGADTWFTSSERTVVVDDLFAPTPDAHRALVRFLIELPLIDRLVFASVPLDDPLPWLVADRRTVGVTATRDETWLRILDVTAALSARGFTHAGSVVIAVKDAILQHNSAAYDLSADGIERTDRPASLHVDVDALGALLLGGVTWATLAASGLVVFEDPEAVAQADALFGTWPQPHAGIYF